jgi:glycosyltransferase involved in cell wall biosynthesis
MEKSHCVSFYLQLGVSPHGKIFIMNKEAFKVSVIIPAHNAESFIQRAIESVSELQEVAEIIVIDDASTDKTAEIIKTLEATEPRLLFFKRVFQYPRDLL